MTTYNITIDDYTMINLLTDRLNYWEDSINKDKYDLIYDFIEQGLDYFASYPDFNPKYIIDDLVINGRFVTQEEVDADPTFYKDIEDNCIYHRQGLYLLNY